MMFKIKTNKFRVIEVVPCRLEVERYYYFSGWEINNRLYSFGDMLSAKNYIEKIIKKEAKLKEKPKVVFEYP
jgi:hypothetical protein